MKYCLIILFFTLYSCRSSKSNEEKNLVQDNLKDFYYVYFTREFNNDSLIILYKNKHWITDVLNTDQSLSMAKKYYLPRIGFKEFSIIINNELKYTFRDGDSCDYYKVSKLNDDFNFKCYEKEPKFY